MTQIKLSSLKKLQRSGRNGIWDVYAENDPENVIVKVLETQFHVFTLKNFRNYAGIMLHPLWLKQYTRDYEPICDSPTVSIKVFLIIFTACHKKF